MLERLADRGQVLRAAGAGDHLSDAVVAEQPRERGAGHRDAVRVRDRAEPIERVEGPVVMQSLVGLGALRHPRAGRERLAAAVLAGQPAARQRPERQVGDVVLGRQRQHAALIAAVEQRERVLDRRGLAGDQRRVELAGVEVADAVRADQALVAERLERGQGRVERDVRVVVVGEVEVDALEAEALEARVQLAHDPVGRETVIAVLGHRVERLGGDRRGDGPRGDPRARSSTRCARRRTRRPCRSGGCRAPRPRPSPRTPRRGSGLFRRRPEPTRRRRSSRIRARREAPRPPSDRAAAPRSRASRSSQMVGQGPLFNI